jgi:hypothetical protein
VKKARKAREVRKAREAKEARGQKTHPVRAVVILVRAEPEVVPAVRHPQLVCDGMGWDKLTGPPVALQGSV